MVLRISHLRGGMSLDRPRREADIVCSRERSGWGAAHGEEESGVSDSRNYFGAGRWYESV